MKIAIFAVEYTVDFDSYPATIPVEFRSKCRNILFDELVEHAKKEKVDLAVLPGGFFRTDFPRGIINGLKHCPPKINVLVGWDNMAGNKREAWVINPAGKIRKKIPEAWKSSGDKFNKDILENITDRTFTIKNKSYAVFCCGDVLIDNEYHAGRKPPIFDSRAAFVLAHSSAPGRSFTPAMCKLEMPVFLSHHLKKPWLSQNYAYNGKYKKNDPKPIGKPIKSESQGLKWIARIYSI